MVSRDLLDAFEHQALHASSGEVRVTDAHADFRMDPDRDYVLIRILLTEPAEGADTWPTSDVQTILRTIDRTGLDLFGSDMPVEIDFNTSGDPGVAEDDDEAFDLDQRLYGSPEDGR